MFIITEALGIISSIYAVCLIIFICRRSIKPLTGPPTLPIIGNLHQIPTQRTYQKFTEWAKKYGEIYLLKLGPSSGIVLTSPRLVKQLIDKKSSIYSNRPASYIGGTLVSDGDDIVLMQYAPQWRARRKLIQQYFMQSTVIKNHLALLNAEAVQLLQDFIITPEHHMLHPRRYTNSIIMSIVYGIRTPTINTLHMKALYQDTELWSELLEMGNTPPLDIYPFLKFIPEALLGNWASRAKRARRSKNSIFSNWLDWVIKRREESGSRASFIDHVLDQQEQREGDAPELNRHAIYFLGGTVAEGGSETSASVILAFIHAMTKWPEVQARAQQEIDSVIGDERSPGWFDYMQLPYVAACVKETMRWRPPLPLGVPHALKEQDVINGMVLPKDSSVFMNIFGMHHDETRFADPDVFDPARYAGIMELAPELANGEWEKRDHYAYGGGRRICPGAHIAERTVFIAIAKLLWALDIKPGLDSQGNIIEPDVCIDKAYSAGIGMCAEPYPCRVTLRSEARRVTVMKEYDDAKMKIFTRFDEPRE